MVTVAEFTVAADEFPLGGVFGVLPDATVELERVVPTTDGVVPYFWVRNGGSFDVAVLERDGIRNVRLVDGVGDEYLLRCEWDPGYEGVLTGIVASNVTLLSAVGTAQNWVFEIRGEDRDAISNFRGYCRERDIPVRVTWMRALSSLEPLDSLTPTQREALELAFHRGYFDSPRRATLADVARELDISPQALGSRIRRGTRRLVEHAVVDG